MFPFNLQIGETLAKYFQEVGRLPFRAIDKECSSFGRHFPIAKI